MTQDRINISEITSSARSAMKSLEDTVAAEVESAGLEPELVELVKIRASQLNGCSFCLDMHAVIARKEGMAAQRLDVLPAWRETDLYSPRERAALALTEAITFVHDGQFPDDVYAQAAEVFSREELSALIWRAIVINSWNRVAITSRTPLPTR